MATNTKRKKRRLLKASDLPPPGILEKLLSGHIFFEDEPSESDLEAAWNEHRAIIMDCIGQPMRSIAPGFFPVGATGVPVEWGCRPWGWWRFESKEMRRLLSGDASLADWTSGNFFGIPRCYASAEAHRSLVFESQADYLARLNLLLPGELERISENKTADR